MKSNNEERRLNIVLLDDDYEDSLLIEDITKNYTVGDRPLKINFFPFQDPSKFLFFIKQPFEIPRLVFLDIKMPKMDGFQVLNAIKGDERSRRVPVVMYSSSDAESDKKRAYGSFANGYIEKSYNLKELSYSISAAIRFFGEVSLA